MRGKPGGWYYYYCYRRYLNTQQQVHIASKHSTTTFTTMRGETRFGKLRAKTGISTSGITVALRVV